MELFRKSLLNEGSLNISITSLLFVGVDQPGTTSAKHVVLQETVPIKPNPTLLVEHEIYFRKEGHANIQRFQPKHYGAVILHSMSTPQKSVLDCNFGENVADNPQFEEVVESSHKNADVRDNSKQNSQVTSGDDMTTKSISQTTDNSDKVLQAADCNTADSIDPQNKDASSDSYEKEKSSQNLYDENDPDKTPLTTGDRVKTNKVSEVRDNSNRSPETAADVTVPQTIENEEPLSPLHWNNSEGLSSVESNTTELLETMDVEENFTNDTSDDDVVYKRPHELKHQKSMTMLSTDQIDSECADLENFMKNVKPHSQSGMIEFIHVFDCGSHLAHMSEILRIFIQDVSMSAFVTNLSTEFNTKEIAALEEIKDYSAKKLIIGTHSGLNSSSQNPRLLNKSLKKVLNNEEEGCFFSVDCKNPDYELGDIIITLASSLSVSKSFPFSWYLFGFKLRSFMISKKCSVISVSNCMNIAEKLNMDRPTVEAALEHLTEQKVILYFREILNDTVFLSVNIISKLFTTLYIRTHSQCSAAPLSPLSGRDTAISNASLLAAPFVDSSSGGKVAIISTTKLQEIIEDFVDVYIKMDNYMRLFKELLIVANYDAVGANIIFPCLLHPLDESGLRKFLSLNTSPQTSVCIECPSTGNEYISMLIVFLLSQSENMWTVSKDNSGNPSLLYKNCVKFYVKTYECIITLCFENKYLYISIPPTNIEKCNLKHISSFILSGLEKIKIILKVEKTFEFQLSYPCTCGIHSHMHPAVYNKEKEILICSVDGSERPTQKSLNNKWQQGINTGNLSPK